MNVLAISIDRSITQSGSSARLRQEEFATHLTSLTIITLSEGPVQEKGNLTIIPVSGSKFLFPLKAFRRAKQYARTADVITVQDPFACGIVGYLLKKRCRKPLHVQLHGDDVLNSYWISECFSNRVWNVVGKFVLKRADAIRAVSERIKRRIASAGFETAKTTVIPVFTSLKKFTGTPKPTHPSAVFVGRLVPQKNPFFLISVWREVVKVVPDATLTIVGEGWMRAALERAVIRSKLEHCVRLVGFDDPRKHYAKAACFILPSIYEGWGLVVIEALAAQVPVIMSDVGCAGEVVVDQENGLVLPIDDLDGFVKATINVLRDEQLRARLVAEGTRSLAKLPTQEETTRAYLASLSQALK